MKETKVEKELLKKVGNYFGKGVKIGALTALLATATGCAPTSGPEMDYGNGGNGTIVDDGNGDNTVDDDKIVTTSFDLPNFAEGTDAFNKTANGLTGYQGSQAFQASFVIKTCTYLKNKAKTLQNQVQPGNALQTTLADAMNYIYALTENLEDVDNWMPSYYQTTAKYMAQIVNNLDGNDQAKFRACYDRLAVQAYENSLTVKKNNPTYPTLVTVNEDKPAIATELQNLGITDSEVEKTLMNLLTQVANNNNIQANTLKDCVNLALNIDGLYGLRDSITIQGGGTRPTQWKLFWLDRHQAVTPPRARYAYNPREHDWNIDRTPMFNDYLDQELQKLQTQSYEMGR